MMLRMEGTRSKCGGLELMSLYVAVKEICEELRKRMVDVVFRR